eukprot:350688-Chlamydomonas_euryale.AAC.6
MSWLGCATARDNSLTRTAYACSSGTWKHIRASASGVGTRIINIDTGGGAVPGSHVRPGNVRMPASPSACSIDRQVKIVSPEMYVPAVHATYCARAAPASAVQGIGAGA